MFGLRIARRLPCVRHLHEGRLRATTILGIKDPRGVVMMADGQVTQGDEIIKNNVRKLRVLSDGKVICGFAGSTVDCLTLVEILEKNLETYQGQLMRACVEMTKSWRTRREYGRLNASLIVADAQDMFIVSGDGDVLQPQDGIASVGSGSHYAKAAARALIENNNGGLSKEDIAMKAMKIAADLCIYTNDTFVMEKIEAPLQEDQS